MAFELEVELSGQRWPLEKRAGFGILQCDAEISCLANFSAFVGSISTPCTKWAAAETATKALQLSSTLSVSVWIHTSDLRCIFYFFFPEVHLPISTLWEYLPSVVDFWILFNKMASFHLFSHSFWAVEHNVAWRWKTLILKSSAFQEFVDLSSFLTGRHSFLIQKGFMKMFSKLLPHKKNPLSGQLKTACKTHSMCSPHIPPYLICFLYLSIFCHLCLSISLCVFFSQFISLLSLLLSLFFSFSPAKSIQASFGV